MWSTIKSYIWWTHPRGSLPYDVMVTLILAFIFITPRYVDFHDKPAPTVAHSVGDTYVVDADTIHATSDADLRAEFSRQLHATIDHWEPLRDDAGNIAAYRVFVTRAARK